MSQINFNLVVVKCPNSACQQNINLSIGKERGGINDKGGWILQCESCNTTFPYHVKNPNDYSSVQSGAKILAYWDDEVPDSKAHALTTYSLNDFPDNYAFDNMLVVETGEAETQTFSDIEENIFFCPNCKAHVEPVLYGQLTEKLPYISKSIRDYIHYYVKGRAGEPDCIIVVIDYTCSCGFETKGIFYKNFNENQVAIKDVHELILIDVVGADLEFTIDGIYDRDACLSVLQKLLVRWQIYYNQVFLAVPFIGFDFKNSEAQRVELWNWLLKNTVPEKTFLLTRKATFNSFIEGSANSGMDIGVLDNYGLLHPTLKKMREKKALFKQDFHAKFYAGFDRKTSEVLVGSFNIHAGSYVENIHFKSYDSGDFFQKYILNMDIVFDPRTIDEQGEFLFITNNQTTGEFMAKVESYSTSRKEKIYELI